MKSILKNTCSLAAIVCLLCGASVALAQVAPAADAAGDDPIIQLSPFEVSTATDRGWAATNALSATRLNTPIKDLPMGITVVTSEFLADTGSTNVLDALKFVASAGAGGDMFENGSTLRGFRSAYPFRNGVKQYYTNFTANIDRVEVVRGAAAVMYGQSFPGGLVNYVTKKPLFRAHGSIDATIGDWGFHDLVLDFGAPLIKDKVAFRGVIQDHETDSWRDNAGTDRQSYNAAVSIRPNSRVTLNLDYQDDKTTWFLATGPVVSNPLPGSNVSKSFLPLSRENNYWGVGAYSDIDVRTYSADLQIRITPWLTSRSIYSRLEDVYSFNVYGPWHADTGNVLAGGDHGPAYQRQTHDTDFYRHYFLIDAEFGGMQHRIQAGFEADREQYGYQGYDYRRADTGTNFPIQGGFNRQALLTNYPAAWNVAVIPPAPQMLEGPWWPGYPRMLPPAGGPTGWYPNWVQDSYNDTNELFLSDSISAFDKKLNVLLGVRHTEFKWSQSYLWAFGGGGYVGAGTNEVGYADNFNASANATWNRTRTPAKKSDYTAPQLGVSYQLTPNTTLYALYSESLFPSTNENTRDGLLVDPANGKGGEVGVKVDHPTTGLSGTFTAFQLIEGNLPGFDPRNTGNQNFVIPGNENESSGLEAEVLWQANPNWSTIAGYAYTDTTVKTNTRDPFLPPAQRTEGQWLGNPKSKATLYTKYTWTEGALRGFNVRGGLVSVSDSLYRAGGKSLQGYGGTSVAIPIDSYVTLDVGAGYRRKIGNQDWAFDVNLMNATSENYISASVKGFAQYGDPTTLRFRVSVEF